MKERTQRDALIDGAVTLFHRQGYAAAGAREIATAAAIPQGSFTNHFRSKEVLAVAALDRYFARLQGAMQATLADRSRSPVERLLSYFDLISERLADDGWRYGCLIPDLAAGVPADADLARDRLVEVMRAQVEAFQAVLDDVGPDRLEPDMGAFVVAAWHGTLLRMKAERGPEALHRFRRCLASILESKA